MGQSSHSPRSSGRELAAFSGWLYVNPWPEGGNAARSGRVVDHPRSDGDAGGLVDQDERPGGPVLAVGIAEQWHGGAKLHTADLVEPELVRVLVPVQRVDVEPVLDVLDQRATGAGRVLDGQLLPRLQRCVRHPADHRVDVL